MSATLNMTIDEHVKRAADMAPSYRVYWPGDQWFYEEYSGNGFWIPPDLGGKMVEHPTKRNEMGGPLMVPANGEYEVRNVYGLEYGKRARPINGNWMRPILSRNALLFEAQHIIKFLMRKHDQRGLTFLTGDPGQDQILKREARKKYQSAFRGWAQSELDARREFLERYKKENPGTTSFPPPKPSQIRAEMLLLRMQADDTAAAAQYRCECGMFEYDDREIFELHLQMRHGKKLEAPEMKAPEPEPDLDAIPPEQLVTDPTAFTEPKKRGPGRHRKES